VRWPWRRRPESDAARAKEEAAADLARARERRPEVEKVSRELREHQKRNGFGPMIERALRGHRS
jgi:hypothetical protein